MVVGAHLAQRLGIRDHDQFLDIARHALRIEPFGCRSGVREFVELGAGALLASDIVLVANACAVIGRRKIGMFRTVRFKK